MASTYHYPHTTSPWLMKEAVPPGPPQPGLELAPNTPMTYPKQPDSFWDQYGSTVHGIYKERTVCGLRVATFLLSLALAVVIVAGAVGGGVAGSLATRNSHSLNECQLQSAQAANAGPMAVTRTVTTTCSVSESTRTAPCTAPTLATASNGGIVVPTSDVTVGLDCPSLSRQGEQVVTLGQKSWKFGIRCGDNFVGDDFGATIAYSLRDCLSACAAHNFFSGKDECKAITFAANMSRYLPNHYGNCWLKRGTGTTDPNMGDFLASAVLTGTS